MSVINISYLYAYLQDIWDSKIVGNDNFRVVNMAEYGSGIDGCHDIDLNMGIGPECNGIRIYDLETAQKTYWEKLAKENSDLYSKIFIEHDHEKYFEHRKLLPGDLRNENSILEFIEFNLMRYGSNCDFYLPKKFFDGIEDLKPRIIELCEKYKFNCKFINPECRREDAALSQEPGIRIFSGFELSDNLYRGLYLNNRQAGAGISGDDGWSLAISGGNLPFHGKVSSVQKKIVQDLFNLSSSLNLTNLSNYFKYFLSENLSKLISELKIYPDELALIQKEYLFMVKFIKENKNIFKVLTKTLSLIEIEFEETREYISKTMASDKRANSQLSQNVSHYDIFKEMLNKHVVKYNSFLLIYIAKHENADPTILKELLDLYPNQCNSFVLISIIKNKKTDPTILQQILDDFPTKCDSFVLRVMAKNKKADSTVLYKILDQFYEKCDSSTLQDIARNEKADSTVLHKILDQFYDKCDSTILLDIARNKNADLNILKKILNKFSNKCRFNELGWIMKNANADPTIFNHILDKFTIPKDSHSDLFSIIYQHKNADSNILNKLLDQFPGGFDSRIFIGNSKNVDNILLNKILDRFPDKCNRFMLQAIAQHQNADSIVLHKILDQFSDQCDNAMLQAIAKHKNADSTTLHKILDQFRDKCDSATLRAIAQHRTANSTTLHKILDQFSDQCDNVTLRAIANHETADSTTLHKILDQFSDQCDEATLQAIAKNKDINSTAGVALSSEVKPTNNNPPRAGSRRLR